MCPMIRQSGCGNLRKTPQNVSVPMRLFGTIAANDWRSGHRRLVQQTVSQPLASQLLARHRGNEILEFSIGQILADLSEAEQEIIAHAALPLLRTLGVGDIRFHVYSGAFTSRSD